MFCLAGAMHSYSYIIMMHLTIIPTVKFDHMSNILCLMYVL